MKDLKIDIVKTSIEWWNKLSDLEKNDLKSKYGYNEMLIDERLISIMYRKEKVEII